ncbi:DUF6537 domain-containing protein, partial [Klebsiella aerogenes]|uniref:DUF6537 domain-containing protein n=1 Tax=Klebsiella aerogenes TaxID=548 RepID=UPI0013D0B07A
RPRKHEFGSWIEMPLRALARLKRLRGTRFDPFGYLAERRMDRELIPWFEAIVGRLVERLDRDTLDRAVT